MNDPEMEAPPSFWVRALYDYHSTDDSALSFSRGDIVEVLTQLESGWWDGLIGTERGWFPSNFVVVISDQEAETELGPRDQEEPGAIGVDPATLDASDSEWVQDELEQAVDLDLGGLQGDDLWLPEVQPNGQIVYVNGAGQRRTELPDTEDMSPPPPVTRPRANTATTQSSLGGFAFVRRTGTPEPWLKRLTDDGHTFYYENPDTGEIVWSRPEPNRGPSTQQSLASSASGLDLRTRFRAAEPEEELTTEDESEPPNRMSVYSDASEVNPRFDDAPTDLPPDTEPRTDPVEVQRRLAPPDPEPIDALAAVARQAIDAVSQCMQSEDRAPHAPLVAQVILAVRNLLYVSGTLAPSPATIAPLALTPDQTPTEPPQGAVAELKQFQRKVTATLSKLVLSARAADSGEDDANARSRVVIDAGELERAVDRFVNEAAERGLTSSNSEGAKHRGVLDTSHIGRGLPGAGIGGRWRGSGFVEPTAKPLTVEVCEDLKRMGAELEQALGGVAEGVKAVRTGDAEDTSTIVGGGDETDGVSTIITRGRTAITALCALLNAAEELDVATKVGRDIEAKRGFVRKSVLEDGIRRVGSRDQLGRIGSRDQLGLNHKASRDKLSRPASRDKLSRMGSRDELGPHALGMSRQASRDQLSRPGSRDKLSRPASRDKLSRQASRDRLSRPGSSHRSPGTPGMRLPTSISPRMPNAENGIDTLRQDTQSTVRPKPSNTLRAETGLKLDTSQDVRLAVRRLEVSKQALYDAGVTLLLASQTVHVVVLRSAGTAPAPTKDDEETTTTGIDANALNLVSSSITSIRLNSREMLNLFDALARTDPAESYVPASSPVPTPGPTNSYRRPSRADIYPPRGPPTRSRADTYSRAETFRTDSFTHAESPYVTSPVDDHLAMMYGGGDMWGDMIYGIDSAPRERVESTTLPRERFDSITRDRMDSVSRDRLDSITRDRVDSVSRDRVDSVTRDTRLDSTESARGTYGRTYPERGIYADAERGRRDDRFYADKRGVGVGGDKPRAPLKHLDSAVSLPQSDVSADSAPGQYSRTGTALGKGRPDDELDFSGEEEDDSRSPPRVHKLTKILGREAEAVIKGGVTPAPIIDTTPWYLKPTYNDPSQILNNTDGGVRGGTLPALVERLTMHDQLDATFIDSFLMTYKSFTTTKELFQLLVERFRIQPPEGLTPQELEEWTDKKQKPLRVRVVNIFRKMLLDPSVIDKEDGYILDHIKAFASEIVNDVPPAKQLIVFVDRILFQGQGDTLGRKYTATIQPNAPPSILPKGGKRLKLLDIEPLELARQLTLLESKQYNAIKPIECLARARDEPAENDSIKTIITTTNKIASWVAFSVLDKEDARRRGNIIRHFISVAEKCRALHNYSSMAALIAGLNSPPIRRLKRTWDAVPAKSTAILDEVEATLDSGKNFTAYKQRLKTVDSACVPFLGVYLTVLTFIQDGNKDFISKENGIINFGKRQKTAEVIREIQSYQAKQYNLSVVDQVQAFIEQSLASVDEKADYWDKSLSMEPREREDEKMTRMLQESGFL